ncbi:hypothetical protein PR003_g33948, partial [Phytophthora rubi]
KQLKQRETQGQDKDHSVHSDAVLYKIDVPANRYDLLCVEASRKAAKSAIVVPIGASCRLQANSYWACKNKDF